MAWSWVPIVVVAHAPNGPLSRELRAEQQQGRFGGGALEAPNWIWLTEAEDLRDAPVVPWQQLGLQHPARGAAWAEFQQDFQQSTGKAPSLLTGAGFDAARLLALADAAPCRCPLAGVSMRWVGWTMIRRRSFRFARPLRSVA